MAETIEIPHYDEQKVPSVGWYDKEICAPDRPAWSQAITLEGVKCRPTIRCNCGRWCGIGAHHVHADGCGWHVFLKLKGYNGGEFKPDV